MLHLMNLVYSNNIKRYLVPLDAVELVAVEVVAAHKVRAVPGLYIAA